MSFALSVLLISAVAFAAGVWLPSVADIDGGSWRAKLAAYVPDHPRHERARMRADEYTPRRAPEPPLAPTPVDSLAHILRALSDLESGRRTAPVRILHLGGTHVGSDRLDAQLRERFQKRFGRAAPGVKMPAGAYPGYRARGVRFDSSGAWTVQRAWEAGGGTFGLGGVAVTAADAKASMRITLLEEDFDAIELVFLGSPDRGTAIVTVEGRSYTVATRTPGRQLQRVGITVAGRTLSVRPAGTGPVTLLSWAVRSSAPGIEYASLGAPDAGLAQLAALPDAVIEGELKALRPDLVIIDHGLGEALDGVGGKREFSRALDAVLSRIAAAVPNTSLLLIGPPDAAQMPPFASKLARGSPATGCRALGDDERANHQHLLNAEDDRLARWYPPPRLEAFRRAIHAAALKHGAYFWNWSSAMGGPCGIHAWVYAAPPLALPDHVGLTEAGYARSADLLFAEVMRAYSGFASAATERTR